MANKTNEFLGTGRRKTSVARVRLAAGTGKITVNGRAFDSYFPLETLRATVSQPLVTAALTDKRHGISRALLKFDTNLRGALKAEGFLTRDPRERERKKYGQPGARKRFQFSKR